MTTLTLPFPLVTLTRHRPLHSLPSSKHLPLRPSLSFRTPRRYPSLTLTPRASLTPSSQPQPSSPFSTLITTLSRILTPTPTEMSTITHISNNLLSTAGPLFFASLTSQPPASPLRVLASAVSKWLDVFQGVLMVRVLLSWFPNMPWEYQPFAAIRDLCDPFLNLFRGIIPPIGGSLDLSPIIAFMLLGVLSGLLGTAPQPA